MSRQYRDALTEAVLVRQTRCQYRPASDAEAILATQIRCHRMQGYFVCKSSLGNADSVCVTTTQASHIVISAIIMPRLKYVPANRWDVRKPFPTCRRFAAALLPRLFGKSPRSHHKGATGRVRTGDPNHVSLPQADGLRGHRKCALEV